MSTQHPAERAPRQPRDFSAWLVDLDGTLYRQAAVRAMMALELTLWGRSAIKTLHTFRHEQERLRGAELPRGADPFELQIERAAQRLGVPATSVAAVVDQWMFDRPGRWLRMFRRRGFLAVISQYQAAGGRTALVSDYPARRKLAAIGVAGLFDVVVACGEPGGPATLKPQPDGLLLAAAQLQVVPTDCLVIGDRADADGEAARRAGMVFRHVTNGWWQ